MANARRKTRSKSTLQSEPPANTDLFAVAMLGGGLLLFLALVSYTPADAPGWWGLSSGASPTGERHNFVGFFGTLAAAITYSAFGAAAYLIPAAMIWFGLGRFFLNARLSARGLIGFAAFIVSGACLLHFQGFFFQSWHEVYNIPGAGGVTGDIMGGRILGNVVGTVGAFLVALIVYLVSLVMVTGFHPMHFAMECRQQFRAYMEEREVRKLAEADEAERLERQRAKLEREERKLEKQLALKERKAGVRVRAKDGSLDDLDASAIDDGAEDEEGDEDSTMGDDEEEEDTLPATIEEERVPQIFDSSVRRANDGERKPSLSEVLRKSKDKSAAGSGESPVTPAREISFPDYELPEFDLLTYDEAEASKPADKRALLHTQNVIIDTLGSFGIKVTAGDITRGPTITRYEIYPSAGLRVSRISQLEADLARATKAERINILAPIPGRDTVGIEIANHDKIMVQLRELLEDPNFSDPKFRIPLALGKDVYGRTIIGDLARMPHLLVAGATGAGKSVCINSIIASILFRFTPDELRFIMVDPKVVEMQMYNALPHLIVPVVTDPKKVLMALRWVVNEMERRYKMFAEVNVRNFESFNGRAATESAKTAAAAAKKGKKSPVRKGEGDDHPEFDFDAMASELTDNDEAFDTDEEVEAATASAKSRKDVSKFEYVFEYEDDEEGNASEADDDDKDVIPAVSAKALLTTHAVHIAPSITNDDITDALPGDDEDEEEEDSAGDIPQKLPYIVVIVDELADLMQTAPADMEGLIARIAQKARAAGIHLIIATQTPRADVVTGIIKANIPSRVAFQVSSALDSRVILDSKGAEKLVGKGDMLYLPPGSSQLTRAQGALISDEETLRLVEFCAEQGKPTFETDIEEVLSGGEGGDDEVSDEDEEILEKCIEVIEQERRASTSLLQRRLRLGYTRAARMMDVLEMRGIIGPGDGARPREILVDFSD
jgi:S-DNA-T family DNA segregation ATPase FtsK/SpoIIIE